MNITYSGAVEALVSGGSDAFHTEIIFDNIRDVFLSGAMKAQYRLGFYIKIINY